MTQAKDDPATRPLADYFFIAGIESSQIFKGDRNPNTSPNPIDATIDENTALETDGLQSPLLNGLAFSSPSKPDDAFTNRFSYASVLSDGLRSTSNRSSLTIRPVRTSSHVANFNDEEFEQAIRKFANERESFLEEIHVSAGAITATSTERLSRIKPRTMRISRTEQTSGLRSSVGSIRRKLSTMKRPHSTSRRSSIRTSKRTSDYNSVIPTPQPFVSSPDMHPLKRRYEPTLLDRYPPKTMRTDSRRCAFPDYIPMFALPNDVLVVSADEKPRSTWHGFAMTSSDGSKLHGMCVTIWIPLNHEASTELERQCEVWRKKNMSNEERELASSLGERVASESARLSRLLAQLPTMPSESSERESLIDEIMTTQEKIELMANILRPVRHAAASRIEGLTNGDTGFWIPRVYGVLGRDINRMSFYKEWLKAVVVPMTQGAVLRVPPSSPNVGMWQPLERYVVNMLVEAPSPLSSITQIEVAVRDLRLYARNEAANELPESRSTDLYALFRCLSIPEIVTLFEYALSESRIILTSSHTAMLYLACTALVSLLYPIEWSGVYIPILPSRLLQAVEAPCPYIVGVEKRFDKFELPEDDFVLVDLDQGVIESTGPPTSLPRQIRRKLVALLQAAATHHTRHGVPTGPPRYATETFPHDAFSTENSQILNAQPEPSSLAKAVNSSSSAFASPSFSRPAAPTYNAFVQARLDMQKLKDSRPGARTFGSAADRTSKASKSKYSPISPPVSPLDSPEGSFPSQSTGRNDSAMGLQAALRDKRSGHFDSLNRRNSSMLSNNVRWPAQPFNGHISTLSTSALSDYSRTSYAPSVYAASTMAASTIMPSALMQHVSDSDTTKWCEGHCMVIQSSNDTPLCAICDESCDEGFFQCNSCPLKTHGGCTLDVTLPCPSAFRPDLVRAAFVRCFASLFYMYRRHLHPVTNDKSSTGLRYSFNVEAFIKTLPSDHAEYTRMLQQTQGFNQFIFKRESAAPEDESIKLFDEIVLAKRNRSRKAMFSKPGT